MAKAASAFILTLVLTSLMLLGSYFIWEYFGRCRPLPLVETKACLNFWNGTFLTEFRYLIHILIIFAFLSIAQRLLNLLKRILPNA